jgi:DMSO/TMAO reductase YedYZ molybdopterin-dependent catalytic subunit
VGIFENNDARKVLENQMKKEGRLPPGQSATLKWPVLHYAEVPAFDPAKWEFRTSGLVEMPLKVSWAEFMKLPRVKVTADFHCVTRWSRFDNHWEGVPFGAVCDLTRPKADAAHVLIHASEGYATNVPLRDLLEENVLFAFAHDGAPLTPEHGGPLRLIVPKLYAWKSAKWVVGLEFLAQDRLGFWEQNGYHRYGDPFKEQRHTGD